MLTHMHNTKFKKPFSLKLRRSTICTYKKRKVCVFKKDGGMAVLKCEEVTKVTI